MLLLLLAILSTCVYLLPKPYRTKHFESKTYLSLASFDDNILEKKTTSMSHRTCPESRSSKFGTPSCPAMLSPL